MELIKSIDAQMEQSDREYKEIESVFNEIQKKLHAKGLEYNKLLRERNKLMKKIEKEQKQEEARNKEALFNEQYQIFVNSLDEIYKNKLNFKFDELLKNMHKFCDHPIVSGNASRMNPCDSSHFMPIKAALNNLTEDVDKKCLELHIKFHNYKLGLFDEWSGGESWNVYCKKCKKVEVREHEVSM